MNLDPDEPFDNAEQTQNNADEPSAVQEEPQAKSATPEPEQDGPVCRICFSGADEADLGVIHAYIFKDDILRYV